ncbi:hypothetical protein HO173_003760 [Letharia columbiana]|uniref:Uncharacterized protein n=1 Tax=Letharia columbiana TaxID=112416 RepID=A0A8H6G0H2_9LECA|nr:uncharacterized protein HO173_003760 [Letharia columbiana]KAF6238126.1 hypothetical protein HO173_003760 [Letharia columbiana]
MNDAVPRFAQIKEYLSLQSRDPIHGVEAYARVQLADAAAIGNSPWNLDHNNVLLRCNEVYRRRQPQRARTAQGRIIKGTGFCVPDSIESQQDQNSARARSGPFSAKATLPL